MQAIPFRVPTEDNGCMYAVAYCSCLYDPDDRALSAIVGIYSTSAPGFARYSGHAFALDGSFLHYASGPDYSTVVEAALLDFWEQFKVPIYAWLLFPRALVDEFNSPAEEQAYWASRQDFCRALYHPRGRAHAMSSLGAKPLFGIPSNGFQPVDAFAPSPDNEEIMQAILAVEA
jgi:hypothetical protein